MTSTSGSDRPDGWWATKVRRTRAYLRARVDPAERAELATWLTTAQLGVFDAMHIADRRHGLDVATTLRTDGVADPEVLLAGLLHDAGKGQTGLLPRIVYALGQAYGPWVWRLGGVLPVARAALERMRTHAETSARLAADAGCSARTVELIRHQDAPLDPVDGRRLQVADEAN